MHPPTDPRLTTALLQCGPRPLASGCRHLAIPCLPEGTSLECRRMRGGAYFYLFQAAHMCGPAHTGNLPASTQANQAQHMNHVKGVTEVATREKPHYHDVAPTLHELRWQLTQASSAAETAWVLRALRQHVKAARPRVERTGTQAAPKRPCPPGRCLPRPPWCQYLDTTLT